MQSQDDMKAIIGIYDASLGARGNETSGKAVLARQRRAMSARSTLSTTCRALRHTGRILVDPDPKRFTTSRALFRVLGGGTVNHPLLFQVNLQAWFR